MNYNDITNRLSEKQKQRLVAAKTQEDMDRLFTPDKLLLTEDQLGAVAGGCMRPSGIYNENQVEYAECPGCSNMVPANTYCPLCPNTFVPGDYRGQELGDAKII